MSNPSESLNLYQIMALIRKPVEVLKKNKSGYNYKYVTDDEILAKITGLMRKYGVSLIPYIQPGTTRVTPHTYKKTKITKAGDVLEENINEILVQSDMQWHWIKDANPEERIIVPWVLVGQQSDASQAFGSALTYTMRYFLLKYFNVSTSDDDPDNWRSKQQEAERQEEMILVETLTNQIDELIRQNINDGNKKALMNLVRKHVKVNGKPSDNYFELTDAAVASMLLNELKAMLS